MVKKKPKAKAKASGKRPNPTLDASETLATPDGADAAATVPDGADEDLAFKPYPYPSFFLFFVTKPLPVTLQTLAFPAHSSGASPQEAPPAWSSRQRGADRPVHGQALCPRAEGGHRDLQDGWHAGQRHHSS